MVFLEVLVYIIRGGEVLLIEKKRGLGAGYINGVGGKVEPGEGVCDAAVRETREEVGLTPLGLRWRGLLEFWNWESGSVESVHFVHLFTASGFEGAPSESDEARPAWFKLSEIPYGRMWEDDKLWFPLMLGGGAPIYGRFVFEGWRLRRHQLIRLDAVDEGFNACAEP
ncbi:hypothetical protein GCM10007981_04030 [Thermocladium modestius]|uniref:Nudix hydrolase domain-containing protein n=1 Tax=Thermocladium modestius TaxID=62609 RepID=A0A830GWD2_9CREN|nr:8-oxo-dGTP diphosphatase [Thermocladium modestius]GGP19619.1 hypothetical protein GCM10007981_04030 [Thermocladium modestius]